MVIEETGDPTSLQEPRKESDATGERTVSNEKRLQRLKGLTGCKSLVCLLL